MEWVTSLRCADDLFCYAVIDRAATPMDFVAQLADWATACGWRTSLQGRKLYWVPQGLTKSAAINEVARRLEVDLLLAAGDSLLDIDLLLAAERGIHPSHGELFEQDWSAGHVVRTRSAGVQAGQEILRWCLDQADLVA